MSKIIEAEFIKVPKPYENDIENTTQEEMDKVFKNMLGHTYKICKSGMSNEYIILGGTTEEAEKEFQSSIYKSLIAVGEDEETARGVAYENEEYDACMYFAEECFEMKGV